METFCLAKKKKRDDGNLLVYNKFKWPAPFEIGRENESICKDMILQRTIVMLELSLSVATEGGQKRGNKWKN